MLNTLHPGYFEGVVLVDPVGHSWHQCEKGRGAFGVQHADLSTVTVSQQAVPRDVPMAQSAIARKDVFANRWAQ
jgi:hypothetical protein